MAEAECGCGGTLEVPDDQLGRPLSCPFCNQTFRAVANRGRSRPFSSRLTVITGPDRVGEQFLLGGDGTIGIGNAAANLIRLDAPLIERVHGALTRTRGGGWLLTERSTTGKLLVNRARVSSRTLQAGDVIGVGEYELRFDNATTIRPDWLDAGAAPDGLYDLHAPPPPAATPVAPSMVLSSMATAPRPLCPNCGTTLPMGTKICVDCGIDIETGQSLATSNEWDEDVIAARAETWIKQTMLPVGVFPIMPQTGGAALSTPYVTWAIAAVTILASAIFFVYLRGNDDPDPRVLNLQLWVGSRAATDQRAKSVRPTLEKHYLDKALRASANGTVGPEEQRRIAHRAEVDAAAMLGAPEGVGLRWHQLFTHVLLHERILPLAIVLPFLLIFGLRVNERIGNVWMLILYPLLAAGAGGIDFLIHRHDALTPTLGAAAAVTALAGMYLVLFPVQRVYLTAWMHFGSFLKFKPLLLRAFWLVGAWIVINNVLPAYFSDEPVSHWAHLGGFVLGALAAAMLLLMRQVNVEGGDLLSIALGRRPGASPRKGSGARTVPA